jgi:autoinducer 2-degrading protein
MKKVILSGHIQVPEAELEEIREALTEHITLTLNEAGCLVFDVKEKENPVGTFTVYEEFGSKEAFEFHQKRVKESKWGAITKNVTRNDQIEGME